MNTRAVNEIARDVRAEWGAKVNYAARPYLNAMLQIEAGQQSFGQDDTKSVVLYFLGNARSFRGPRAKELKAELKAAVGLK